MLMLTCGITEYLYIAHDMALHQMCIIRMCSSSRDECMSQSHHVRSPSVVVLKALVAEVLPGTQVVPARGVAIAGTPGKAHRPTTGHKHIHNEQYIHIYIHAHAHTLGVRACLTSLWPAQSSGETDSVSCSLSGRTVWVAFDLGPHHQLRHRLQKTEASFAFDWQTSFF